MIFFRLLALVSAGILAATSGDNAASARELNNTDAGCYKSCSRLAGDDADTFFECSDACAGRRRALLQASTDSGCYSSCSRQAGGNASGFFECYDVCTGSNK